jgi:3-dehydroquinate dehydratase-2
MRDNVPQAKNAVNPGASPKPTAGSRAGAPKNPKKAGKRVFMSGKKIMVINGPSLNLLGQREPGLYGSQTLEEINEGLKLLASRWGMSLEFAQHNCEGKIVESLHRAGESFDGAILNAAAYTHTSVAIRDAVLAIGKPVVEVHLTNPAAREGFRRRSLLAGAALGSVSGFGAKSYELALYWFTL